MAARIALLAMAVMLCNSARGDHPVDGLAIFEKSIRPVLVAHCYECHSAEAAGGGKLQAGLMLDSRQVDLSLRRPRLPADRRVWQRG